MFLFRIESKACDRAAEGELAFHKDLRDHLLVFLAHPLIPAVEHLQPLSLSLSQHLRRDVLASVGNKIIPLILYDMHRFSQYHIYNRLFHCFQQISRTVQKISRHCPKGWKKHTETAAKWALSAHSGSQRIFQKCTFLASIRRINREERLYFNPWTAVTSAWFINSLCDFCKDHRFLKIPADRLVSDCFPFLLISRIKVWTVS